MIPLSTTISVGQAGHVAGHVEERTRLNEMSAIVDASQIAGATVTGRQVITAVDGAAIRTLIGAGTGTSNLVIGTTAGTAADAGALATSLTGKANTVHTHVATDISNSTTIGRSVMTAADAAAARTAIGAGTSNLVLGTTNGTAADGGALASSWTILHSDQVDHVFWNKTTATWGATNLAYSVHHFHSEHDLNATVPAGVTDLDIWWTA